MDKTNINLNSRQHEDHETDPVTPGGDDGAFVVDEDAGSAAENRSIVTRSSSAREVVWQISRYRLPRLQ